MTTMKALFLIIGLFIYNPSFSQERDTFQPDSIYRVNNVKARMASTVGKRTKSKLIYQYDKQGHCVEFILTDNFIENNPQMKIEYQYNDSGKLISEVQTSYSGGRIQIQNSKLDYDEKGRVTKKTQIANKQIVNEETYTYDPLIQIEKQYRDGTVYREQATYYDSPNFSNRFTGLELADKNAKPLIFKMPNGKTVQIEPKKEDDKWDYQFQNTLDERGRIIQRKRLVNSKLQDDIIYQYNDKGLLIEKSTKRLSLNFESKELFVYQFWN